MTLSVRDFVAGWIGGIAGLVASHPIETIKVRQQTLGLGPIQATIATWRYEGMGGFYKGLAFPLLTVGPINSIFFGIYGNFMRHAVVDVDTRYRFDMPETTLKVFAGGCLAGVFQVLLTSPIEYVKTVQQAETATRGPLRQGSHGRYHGPLDTFATIVRAQGPLGLYRGCWTLFLRDVPTYGLYTLTYEWLLYSVFDGWPYPVLNQVIAGGTAGVASWVTVLPLDVIKSHLQTDDPKRPHYRGIIDCFQKLYKAEGMSIFFRGMTTTFWMSFVKNAHLFVAYEATYSFFRMYDEHETQHKNTMKGDQ